MEFHVHTTNPVFAVNQDESTSNRKLIFQFSDAQLIFTAYRIFIKVQKVAQNKVTYILIHLYVRIIKRLIHVIHQSMFSMAEVVPNAHLIQKKINMRN